MFKRCFALMLALCLLLSTASVAYMEEGIATDEGAFAEELLIEDEEAAIEEEGDVDFVSATPAEAVEEKADPAEETADPENPENTDEAPEGQQPEETADDDDAVNPDQPATEPAKDENTEEATEENTEETTEEPAVEEPAEEPAEDTAPEAVTEAPAAPVVVEETVDESAKAVAAEAAMEGATPELVLTGSAKHTMNKGETLQLNLNGLTAKSFKSSKKKVAKVSGGVITAKKTGTTKITVTTTRGKKKASIKVKVIDPYKATKITLNETGLIYLFKKNTLQLTATMEPANTTSTVKWSSSNKKVATVSKNGLVKGKKKGKAVITAKTSSGKKARVTIKVINKGGTATGMIPEWSPDEANHFVYRGAVDTYVVSMNPFNANANVTWTTDNPNVLAVVASAQSGDLSFWCDVQGVNNGSAVLTATDTVSGLSQSVRITVKEPPAPEAISFPNGNIVMSLGQKLDVPYVVTPSTSLNNNYNRATVDYDPSIVSITYDSNNADRNCLGTMDYNLHITAVGRGTTTVTVRLKNGVNASFTLTVQ